MNYQQARNFIKESERFTSEMGLDKIRILLEYIGNPEKELSFVHISGTNGKGSVLSYVSTALSMGGYRVGRYISPTLYCYEERFQIDGIPIEKEMFACLMGEIAGAVKKMEQAGYSCPSPFELETALAFLYFVRSGCDLVVLECGMGGIRDATNVIENTLAAVFTSISMDHTEYLGDTLEKIALEKSGIVKPGAAVVSTRQKPEVAAVLEKACVRVGIDMVLADYHQASSVVYDTAAQSFVYGGITWTIHQGGMYQIENAVIAIEVLKALQDKGFSLTESQMQEGMAAARWNGRFSVLREKPVFLVDGAHNPAAAAKFVKSLLNGFTGRRIIYIMGVFRDKDYREIVRITVPYAREIITIETPGNDRALPAEELAGVVRQYTSHVRAARTLGEAVREAFAMAGPEDVIAAFGSLSFIGELTELAEKNRGENE